MDSTFGGICFENLRAGRRYHLREEPGEGILFDQMIPQRTEMAGQPLGIETQFHLGRWRCPMSVDEVDSNFTIERRPEIDEMEAGCTIARGGASRHRPSPNGIDDQAWRSPTTLPA